MVPPNPEPETSASDVPTEVQIDGEYHDALGTPARRLLYDLVSIPSVYRNEREAAERLVAFFEAHGREVWLDEVGNVRAPADDSVLLTSHIDTVPGDIPVEIKDGEEGPELWGRGTVDATGPLVALAVVAVEYGVSFVGVVREEIDSRGAWHLIEDREEPDALVNGEPSGWDGITLGYRGILEGRYVATSESGHTSRPEPNAIQQAMDWWQRVDAFFEPDEWGPIFEQVTTKPVNVEGGTSEDGLAVEVTMDVQFRVPPKLTVEDVRERAEGELEVGALSWKKPSPPVMKSPRTAIARAFRAAIREQGGDPRLLRKTGTSDMNVYASAWDCQMATYGPGDSDLDHAPDEHLPLADLDRSVDVLRSVVADLTEE